MLLIALLIRKVLIKKKVVDVYLYTNTNTKPLINLDQQFKIDYSTFYLLLTFRIEKIPDGNNNL